MLRDKKAAKLFQLACFFLIAVLATSCGSVSSKEEKQHENLKGSVEAFNSAFRWEDYKTAAIFINPDQKELFWNEVDKFKGKIRLVDFQVRDIAWKDKSNVATAIVFFQFYKTSAPTLETVNFQQKWYYSEKDKHWRVGESGFQAITKEGKGL